MTKDVQHALRNDVHSFSNGKKPPTWRSEAGALTLSAWRARRPFRGERGTSEFGLRGIAFEIVTTTGDIAAIGALDEWSYKCSSNGEDYPTLAEFYYLADEIDIDTAADARAICQAFEQHEADAIETPFDWGAIVVFRRLRIIAPQHSAAIWELVGALLKRCLRRASILVLKAYPLEYEGGSLPKPYDRPRRPRGVDARRLAMMRLYAKRLSVVPLGRLGDEGWMWRAARKSIGPSPFAASLFNDDDDDGDDPPLAAVGGEVRP